MRKVSAASILAKRPHFAGTPLAIQMPYWVAGILTGLVSALYAIGIDHTLEFPVWLFQSHPYWLFAWTPFCFIVARALVVYFAPVAAGSGIPQVMAALEVETDDKPQLLRRIFGKRVLFVKIASSLVMVAGGSTVGREGPMIHIASCLFHQVAKRWKRFAPPITSKSWVLAGAAAGIAAAFNTPLGGIVFAIEELTSPHFYKIKSALIASVIVAGLVAQAILGPYLYVGTPNIADPHWKDLVSAVMVGLAAGVLGSLFGRILSWASPRLRTLTRKQGFLWAIFCGLAIASMSLMLGTQMMGGGQALIREQLFGEYHGNHSALLLPARFIAGLLSFLAGGAGGIFAPALAMGAELGANLATAFPVADYNLMVEVGMTGFLVGLTQAPFTAFVLVMEMTNKHNALFPLMLGALTATAVSKRMGESYYHHQAKYFASQFT